MLQRFPLSRANAAVSRQKYCCSRRKIGCAAYKGNALEHYKAQGFTPFEFIEFLDESLNFEIKRNVNASPDHCYTMWEKYKFLECLPVVEEAAVNDVDQECYDVLMYYR